MQVLESLDPDLVMKALEKQLDAARVRRVAAGTESVRWKLRETASFGRSSWNVCHIFLEPKKSNRTSNYNGYTLC